MKATFLSLALLATSAFASDVLVLGNSDFATTVQPEKLMLVEFYAPWCGHCKALAPEYEKAATELKNDSVKLAKVDCTTEADLCAAHGVNGYPTLKVFRSGEAAEYGGSRKADGIISYMKKQALPAVSILDSANHTEFSKADRIVVVAYLEGSDSTNTATFTEFAEGHRDDFLFGISTDSSVFSTAGIQPPAVVLYKTFDEGRNDFTGSFTSVGLSDFVKENSTPLLDEISPENFALYAESGIPLAYLFIEEADSNRAALIKSVEPVAKEFKGKVNFVWIDATKFSDHAKSLNLQEPVWPSFAIQEVAESQKYPLDQKTTITAESLREYVGKFVRGEVKPSIKSEPIPTTQSEGAYVLVADEFEKVTNDSTRDMFIEFYAPWCGHCKKLAPIWEQLGERFYHKKDKILIAKFDAHNNDVPAHSDIKIQGFPTLKFKQAGSSSWIDYNGDRSMASFLEFIDQSAVNKVEPGEANSTDDHINLGAEDEDEDEDFTEPVEHDEL